MAAGTVTYRCPAVVKGTATAPTAAQVSACVIADVTMADGSTVTTITHNFGSTQVSTNGLDGSPHVHFVVLTAGATPVGAGLVFTFLTNAIQVTNTGGSAAGNGQTYRIWMWHHSLITNYTV